ncbi:MAG: sugar ABC transporter substrate-binding protein [Acidimicrobiales bacterium]
MTKNKTLRISAGAALVAMILAGCGSSGTSGKQGSSSGSGTAAPAQSGSKNLAAGKKVVYDAPVLDPVWIYAGQGFTKEAKKLGMVPSQTGPSALAISTDVNEVHDSIDSGAQGIAMCAFVPAAFTQVLTEAKQKGIPVITVNCDTANPDLRAGFVGTVAASFGAATAQHLAQVIGTKKVLHIVDDQTSVSSPLQNGQYQAFLAGLTKAGIKYTVVTRIADNSNTATALTDITSALRSDPSANLVYCLEAQCAGAATIAVHDTGESGRVDIIGIDNEAPTIAGIKSGAVLFSAAQPFYQMGVVAARDLYNYYNHKPVPQITDSGVIFIDKTNAAKYAGNQG